MTISGVSNAYSYANYTKRIDTSSTDADVSQISQVNQPLPVESSISSNDQPQQQATEIPKPSRTGNLEKIIFDFKKNNEFNLVGAQSKAEDLDVDMALSNMKKDSVLDQYKFFVKSSLVSDQDGSVRQVAKR